MVRFELVSGGGLLFSPGSDLQSRVGGYPHFLVSVIKGDYHTNSKNSLCGHKQVAQMLDIPTYL